jgi:hypothetical protein
MCKNCSDLVPAHLRPAHGHHHDPAHPIKVHGRRPQRDPDLLLHVLWRRDPRHLSRLGHHPHQLARLPRAFPCLSRSCVASIDFVFLQWFAAIHFGLTCAIYWCLLVNGFVGFQVVEDGTRLSLWVRHKSRSSRKRPVALTDATPDPRGRSCKAPRPSSA